MVRYGPNRRGFSLIELLTVIAIIAILAALLFPVFSSVREKARQTTCMSNMHEIGRSLAQYQLDNGFYPVSLRGLVGDNGGALLASSGKYLKNDKSIFVCPDNNYPATPTGAVYTAGTPLADTPVSFTPVTQKAGSTTNSGAMSFYGDDSYDIGPRVTADGKEDPANKIDAHYSLDWTGGSGPTDAPNQLKYPNVGNTHADDTVVTWCTFHVAINHASVIPVLMLNGTAKTAPVDRFVNAGPLNFKF